MRDTNMELDKVVELIRFDRPVVCCHNTLRRALAQLETESTPVSPTNRSDDEQAQEGSNRS